VLFTPLMSGVSRGVTGVKYKSLRQDQAFPQNKGKYIYLTEDS